MRLPALIVHADWSLAPKKRMMAVATLGENGRYYLTPPQPVGNLDDWLLRLGQMANGRSCLIGVDFPIGLPATYAKLAGIDDFLTWLPLSAAPQWASFYQVAERVEQIGVKRPFYPKRPGGTKQQHLLDGLGVATMADLRRVCDHSRPDRRPAAPLFWTMGAQQVGKAAITGWRDWLVPNLNRLHIWPFSGELDGLLRDGKRPFTVAEVYPAEVYRWLGIRFGEGGKGSRTARQQQAAALHRTMYALNLVWDDGVETAVRAGFSSDDAFDAFVGMLGMVWVMLEKRPLFEPADPTVRQVEGWIFGQTL